jgi:hypothetical protein
MASMASAWYGRNVSMPHSSQREKRLIDASLFTNARGGSLALLATNTKKWPNSSQHNSAGRHWVTITRSQRPLWA